VRSGETHWREAYRGNLRKEEWGKTRCSPTMFPLSFFWSFPLPFPFSFLLLSSPVFPFSFPIYFIFMSLEEAQGSCGEDPSVVTSPSYCTVVRAWKYSVLIRFLYFLVWLSTKMEVWNVLWYTSPLSARCVKRVLLYMTRDQPAPQLSTRNWR